VTTPEIIAAERHLKEMKELGESRRIIELAEARLRDAQAGLPDAESSAVDETVDAPVSLGELGLSDRIVEALRIAADQRNEPELLTPEGLRQWIAVGNDLVDLDDIGRVSARQIIEALQIE
jgi:hypothetical protein